MSPKSGESPFSFLNWEGNIGAFIRRTDWLTPLILLGLTTWSILAIYSTNSLKTPAFFDQEFAKKQLIFVCIGWGAYWAFSFLEPKVLERFAWWIYTAGILLLVPIAVCALLNMNLGTLIAGRFGARRWIFLGGFSIQPSEFAKISTLILLAFTVGRGVVFAQLLPPERQIVRIFHALLQFRPWEKFCAPLLRHLPLIVRFSWIVALPFALIFVEPDLGSALLYFPMVLALLLIANVPLRFFAILALFSLSGAAVLTVDMTQYGKALQEVQANPVAGVRTNDPAKAIRGTFNGLLPIKNYHRERIMTLVAPRVIDPDRVGTDLQPRQARMAVSRGEFSGRGFQEGTLVRLGWLPEMAAHNDFLFSCISEESGFVGSSSIIALFGLLVCLCLKTAARAADKFGACIAAGVAVITAAHVVVNVGMNIGIMPVTGISLPFFSYGGSFILSCFLLFGIAQSVHRSSQPPVLEEGDDTEIQASSQLSRRSPSV
jgi:rod shape determining protein RodA